MGVVCRKPLTNVGQLFQPVRARPVPANLEAFGQGGSIRKREQQTYQSCRLGLMRPMGFKGYKSQAVT